MALGWYGQTSLFNTEVDSLRRFFVVKIRSDASTSHKLTKNLCLSFGAPLNISVLKDQLGMMPLICACSLS